LVHLATVLQSPLLRLSTIMMRNLKLETEMWKGGGNIWSWLDLKLSSVIKR